MWLWYFVSHDMHVIPSSLQVVTLTSAVEDGLSKFTTLQKLTVRRSPPSITAALLKAVTVIRSLGEVTLHWCDFGMYVVCVYTCASLSLNMSFVATSLRWGGGSASILSFVDNMQVCNEYDYAYYEFH